MANFPSSSLFPIPWLTVRCWRAAAGKIISQSLNPPIVPAQFSSRAASVGFKELLFFFFFKTVPLLKSTSTGHSFHFGGEFCRHATLRRNLWTVSLRKFSFGRATRWREEAAGHRGRFPAEAAVESVFEKKLLSGSEQPI